MTLNADGSWRRYAYDAQGHKSREWSGFMDAGVDAPTSQVRMLEYGYAAVDADEQTQTYNLEPNKPRTVTEWLNGQIVGRTWHAYYDAASNGRIEIEERAGSPTAVYGDAGNQRTEREFNPFNTVNPNSQCLKQVLHSDEQREFYAYAYGTLDTNGTAPYAFTNDGTNAWTRIMVTYGTSDHPDGIAYFTKQTAQILDGNNRTVQEETYLCTMMGTNALLDWVAYTHDEDGRVIAVRRSNGTLVETEWGCCGKTREVAADGSVEEYTYDSLKRLVKVVRLGTNGQPEVTADYALDAAGRRVGETRTAVGVTPLVTSNRYDMAGRLVWSQDAAGLVTSNAYDPNGLMETSCLPGGGTRIVERFKDGRTKNISGTATVAETYNYGVMDLNTADRVTATASAYQSIGSVWWNVRRSLVYANENSTLVQTGAQRTQATGLSADLTARSVSVDVNGNTNETWTSVDRSAAKTTRTTRYSDSTMDELSVTVNGRLVSTRSKTGLERTYAYDGMGRQTAVVDPRTGTSGTTYDGKGRVIQTTDAAGNATSIGYDDATGRRIVETNALGTVTRQAYDIRGNLLRTWGATYPVQYAYDEFGRMTNMTTNQYLQLTNETLVAAAVTPWTNVLMRIYDQYGRPAGFNLNSDYQVAYNYDTLGRFNSVTSSFASFAPFVVNYSYLQNSDLLSGYSDSASGLQVTRTYEDHRNLITQIKNAVDTTTISQYDYSNDAGGRRTSVKHSGTAFETGSAFNKYAYNTRSEVTNGDRYWGSNLDDTSDSVDGQSFAYGYDNIGNRTSSSRDNDAMSYTANALNQYTQRTIPNGIDVLGSAETGTTVTVNDLLTTRYGKYWYKALTVTNSSAAAYQDLNVVGVYNPPGTNDPDVVSTTTGHVFVAKTPETFSYDADGNLLSDGRFNYSWDCENRLIVVETLTNLPASVPRVKVEFAYDYMSRRVSKAVYNWIGNDWAEVETRANVFNGWDLLRETVITQQTTTNWYVHGLDLSGTLSGAGGIGGILSAKYRTNDVAFTYDGNGNVSELIASAGGIAAHYEYSPFGETLVSTGPLAKENKFRFSTKPFDDDTGLSLYEYRVYGPSIGRWLNRDPIGERGGLGLYASFMNSPIVSVDALGRNPEAPSSITSAPGNPFSSPNVLAHTPASSYTECECKCSWWPWNGPKMRCSVQVVYWMTFANNNAASTVWTNNSAPSSLPSEPSPPNWGTWTLAQKYAFVLAHENRHVAAYTHWFQAIQIFENALENATYSSLSACNQQKDNFVQLADSTWNTMYHNEIDHSPAAGW